MKSCLMIVLSLGLLAGLASAKNDYYTEAPQFHFTPDPDAPRTEVGRFGPIGLALELRKPNFTIYIKGIEDGSPAAATGKLKPGQIIESINGEVLKDIDPRVQLGNMITKIEASGGTVRLMVKDDAKGEAKPVEFKIPAMSAYSGTWPVDCEKSDRIVREMADYLRQQENWGWGAALFMLSTGEDADLAEVRKRFSGKLSTDNPGFPWSIGYTGPAICEYYLRTGDESVLPAIKARADYLTATIYNGSWMGRGGANYGYMAGGHMNAAGVHCLTFLLLAKECGVDVDEATLQTTLVHFFRFAGRGNVAYGDGLPEGGMVDNGRVGGLAFAMQAAANLTPEGESSVYAKARDISATKSFYSTSWLFHGHTGGGIGELWRGSAMGLMKDKRPQQYRTFMDERRWVYELARTHEGAFGWAAGQNVNYTAINNGRPNGNYIPLIYTLPRKQLRIFGAPPTEFSKTYKLPDRPWGTPADDVFYSLEAGEYAPGERVDVTQERLKTDASMKIGARLGDPVQDEKLLAYAHHIEEAVRSGIAGRIVSLKRYHLIVPLLKSDDPRGRRTGLQTITGGFKAGRIPEDQITDEMFELAAKMINDPDESWWVVEAALRVLAKAKPAQIAPHVDRLAHWLEHDEWWLRRAALEAVTPVAADKRFYKQILPIVGDMVAHNERAVALSPVSGLVRELQTAEPEVQRFAVKTLGRAYLEFPTNIPTPGNRDMSAPVDYLLTGIARNLAAAPGGFDELYEVSTKRFPDKPLPHLDLYMSADATKFGPKVKQVFEPLMREQIIWQYVARNVKNLDKELNSKMPGRAVEGLVDLYQKVGVSDYDWKLWGPARDKIEWQYTSFDPPEKMLWERNKWRYRPVTWPKGAEQWMTPGFDAKAAGWKTGYAPFAHNDGKLEAVGGCAGDDHFCGCGNPPKTFWDKEVLLMRTTLKLPAMENGYAYRFLVGGRSHVGGGDGSDVWFNGKRQEGRRKSDPSLSGVGKRVGGRPWFFVIDQDFRATFDGDPVTVATSGFLKLHRVGKKMNYQTFWFEKMKLPTLGEKEILKAMQATPMLTSAWQSSMADGDKFEFNGTFEPNDDVLGTWVQLGSVATIEQFNPSDRLRHNRNWFGQITFKSNGRTGDSLLMYSGDKLLDVRDRQALVMAVREIDGAEYLFIEAGGFKEDRMDDWASPYYVLKRK
jgi:hypothetical protein